MLRLPDGHSGHGPPRKAEADQQADDEAGRARWPSVDGLAWFLHTLRGRAAPSIPASVAACEGCGHRMTAKMMAARSALAATTIVSGRPIEVCLGSERSGRISCLPRV